MNPWEESRRHHEEVVSRLVETIRAVPPDRWMVAPAPGKWSAAEVAMHLVLSYDHLTAEQAGTRQIAVRVPRWKAWLLRRTVLPRLLAGRPIPSGVRAPREVRPFGEMPSADAAIAQLNAASLRWTEIMTRNQARGGGQATHPFFGALSLPTTLRFVAIHSEHHRRQIERAAAGLTMHGP